MATEKGAPENRDSFRSKWGFILACIGSAVGMGNIWLFPVRVSKYGGATFLIPYFIFVMLIGSTGVIGEMAFGRATGMGPIGAFGKATEMRTGKKRLGETLGLLPVVGSLALAIGYSVVVGWIFKYTFGSLTGSVFSVKGVDALGALFGSTAVGWGNNLWQVVGMAVTLVIMALGIGSGIEKANKVMMPLFFLMFIGLVIYVATLPGALDAYRYIFILDPKGLADPLVWIYALGQAFFSLSIAGNGTLIYGSYLSKGEDVPSSAKMVAVFDTIAALLAALVIIPAMSAAGEQLSSGGPGLLFIFLPHIFQAMPGGQIIMLIFFIAVLFAGLTSLINLFEAPIATLQEMFHLGRIPSMAIIGGIGIVLGLCIQGIVSDWMDFLSIYVCPLGAGLAGIMFFWVCRKEYTLEQVNLSRSRPLGKWFYPLARYVFCGVTVLVLVVGAVLGGIG